MIEFQLSVLLHDTWASDRARVENTSILVSFEVANGQITTDSSHGNNVNTGIKYHRTGEMNIEDETFWKLAFSPLLISWWGINEINTLSVLVGPTNVFFS